MKKLTILAITLFLGFTASSQTWELGLFAGGAVYNGDIDVTFGNFLPQIKPAVAFFGDYHFNGTWGLRTQLTFAQLYGNEEKYPSSSYRQSLGRSFQTPITELSLTPEFTVFRLNNLSFYAFGGIAVARFTPTTNFNIKDVSEASPYSLNVAQDLPYQKTQTSLALPIGGGIKWIMSEKYALGAEVGGRKTFTDYIDGISKAGGSLSKDYYFFGGVSFSVLFDSGNKRGDNNRFGYQGGVSCPHF